MRIIKTIVTAGVATLALGAVTATTAANAAPDSVSRVPVLYNYWNGSHQAYHYFGSVRPGVWGNNYGEPIQNIHWAYWGKHSAKGKGLYIHMSCQPCRVSIYLHDVRTSHGTRFFKKAREDWGGGSEAYLHWSFSYLIAPGDSRGDWVG